MTLRDKIFDAVTLVASYQGPLYIVFTSCLAEAKLSG